MELTWELSVAIAAVVLLLPAYVFVLAIAGYSGKIFAMRRMIGRSIEQHYKERAEDGS